MKRGDDMVRALGLLKDVFGYDSFRQGQGDVIERILDGQDTLCIMPTGAGKSVCFQIPALMLEGVTVVVSPLISLMKDQVSALVQAGVRAAYLNSSLTPGQQQLATRRAREGAYKILYVAPERLLTESFLSLAQSLDIRLLVVDEAHCVSQWGQDFRPTYLDIAAFAGQLLRRPVVAAFTATATERVKADIVEKLRLRSPYTLTTGFDRPNLYFQVKKPQRRKEALLAFLDERREKSGIIYCSTRKTVEDVCDLLASEGYPATRYHAGLSDGERKENQEDFLYDRKTVMVATNAFGMGIDKSNVSYVVHFNMPKNIESYYQEAGRAGRDGEPADCLLLYGGQDVFTNRYLIEKTIQDAVGLTPKQAAFQRERDMELLNVMTRYAATTDCLRGYILQYFGDAAQGDCGHCGNCDTPFETMDATESAQKILACIAVLDEKGRHFGRAMIVDILRGVESQKIRSWKLESHESFGSMADTPARLMYFFLDVLTEREYLASSADQRPVLLPGPLAARVLLDGERIVLKLPVHEEREKRPRRARREYVPRREAMPESRGGAPAGERRERPPVDEEELFDRLRKLRGEIASERNVPAYVVFPDAALRDMCRILPRDEEEFLSVSGVGRRKLEQFGEAFLRAIREFTAS